MNKKRSLNSIGIRMVILIVLRRSADLTASGQNSLSNQQSELKEFCEWESFNATCRSDEVIVIGTARYGRMRLGRCVTKNYGHIGCGSDVTSYLDGACSGRHSCVISVIKLHDKISCPTDFKSYLEASYECARVLTLTNGTCNDSRRSTTKGGGGGGGGPLTGLLSSVVAAETGIGTDDCPWIIRVEDHQRINITLFDFTMPPPPPPSDQRDVFVSPSSECNEYAVITETGSSSPFNTTVCGGRQRHSVVFVSNSQTVEVRIVVSSKQSYFLLKYEAFGCAQIVAPAGAWVANNGHLAVVRCNETDESWRLMCRGRRWDGYLGNCSAPIAAIHGPDIEWVEGTFPYGILLVIALGVLIGVAAGALMLLAVLTYMRRRRIRKIRSRSNYILDDNCTGSRDLLGKLSVTGSTERRTPIFNPIGGSSVSSDGSTWQRTRPLPIPSSDYDLQTTNGIIMMPELPSLSSPYSLDDTEAPPGGAFTPFGGPGYHEQCIDLLRRSGSSGRRPARTAAGRDQGPYYFKLDLTHGGSGGQGHGHPSTELLNHCIMCQASSSNSSVPIPSSAAAAAVAAVQCRPIALNGEQKTIQLDGSYQF